jgi:hypothetical protein
MGALNQHLNRNLRSVGNSETFEFPGLHPATAVLALREYGNRTDTEEYPYGLAMTISGTTSNGEMIHQTRVINSTFLERSDAILQAILSGNIVEDDDIETRDSDTKLTKLMGATDLKVTLTRVRLDPTEIPSFVDDGDDDEEEGEFRLRRGRRIGASRESGGSFWKYWIDECFPQDLSFLQVYKKSQRDELKNKLMNGEPLPDENYELDCFGNSLMYLDCPKETLLKYFEVVGLGDGPNSTKTMFSGTQSGWLPSEKIPKVAKLLKINVALTYYDKKHKGTNQLFRTWQGDEQSEKWYPIGRLAGHYFPDVDSEWTHWAVSHIKQINEKMERGELKKYESYKEICRAVGYRPNPSKQGQQLLKRDNITKNITFGRLLTVLMYGVSSEECANGLKRKRVDESKEQIVLMKMMDPDDYILSTNLHYMFKQAMQERNLPDFWNDGNFKEVLETCSKKKERKAQPIMKNIVRRKTLAAGEVPITDLSKKLHANDRDSEPYPEFENLFRENGLDESVSNWAFRDFFCRKTVVGKGKERKEVDIREDFVIVAFDFETDTITNDHHSAYMCSVAYYVNGKSDDTPFSYRKIQCLETESPENYNAELITKTFIGENCAEQLHDFFEKRFLGFHVLAVAHNLRYDFNLFMEKSNSIMTEAITKTTSKTNTARAYTSHGNGIDIRFLDSYALISTKLSKFGGMFDLTVEKEIMPYSAYTLPRLNSNPFMNYNEVEEHLPPGTKLEDFIELVETKTDALTDVPGLFNMIKYASFYCEKDCEVLLKGFNKNRSTMYAIPYNEDGDMCKLDVAFATSSSQYASNFASVAGCYDDTYVFSGTLREYMQRAIVGGRVMVSQNIPHATKDEVDDFDACSLYPSAMYRMKDEIGGFPCGQPKLWTSGVDLSASNVVQYYLTIKITKVGRYLKFPIVPYIDEDGGRHFSNDLVGKQIVLDRVMWEDAQKFQEMEGEVVCGVYFDSGVNPKIADVIKILYEKRVILKRQKKTAEQLTMKLIMNSIYGRTIMKPINQKMEFKYGKREEIMRFIFKHSVSISEFYFVRDDFCIIYRHQPIIEHWSAPHIGAFILSMSKRIMNEVIVTAEEENCTIHYQDTDSMHINVNDLKKLEKKYTEKYDRVLVGEYLGQFHCDFEGKRERLPPTSVESAYVGKKIYIDKLKYVSESDPLNVEYDYHLRMKGVPTDAVIDRAEKFGNDTSVMDVYKKLLNWEEIEFDLTSGGKPRFEGNKSMVTTNKTKFLRNIRMSKRQYDRAIDEATKFPPINSNGVAATMACLLS